MPSMPSPPGDPMKASRRNKLTSKSYEKRLRKLARAKLLCESLESRQMLTTAAIGEQFLVAETPGFIASPAAMAVQADGSFVTAWETLDEDGSGFGIFAQRYDATGNPLAPAFQVNTYSAGDQSAPAIAIDSAGNFLVTWQSKNQDGDGLGVYGQWYDHTGGVIGSEFRVNTTTAGDQSAPAVAIDNEGDAIVAWQSDGQDGDGLGVFYTRLDGAGDTAGAEVQVNDAFLGVQQAPTVATAANGNFVIAWEAIDPTGGSDASLDIFAKVYDDSGTAIVGEYRVNSETLRDQVTPQAAMDANGDYVIAWVGSGIPGSGSDVFAQRFNAGGVAQGTQFRVNDTTRSSQVAESVGMDANGNFLIAWQSTVQDGFSEGIFAREYDAAGNTLAGEFQVNTVAQDPQALPTVAMNAAGETVVAWRGKNEEHKPALFAQRFKIPNSDSSQLKIGTEFKLADFAELEENGASASMDPLGNSVVVFESYDQDGSALGVFGQILDNFGDPIGPAFLVNSGYTAGNQSAPAVARGVDGSFVVTWQSASQDGDSYGIYAQRYGSDGLPIGDAFLVNTTTTGDQTAPAIAMDAHGNFVIVWQGDAGDGSTNIYAQRYAADGSTVGDEFTVNHFTALDQMMPAVTMNNEGRFAIAWVSNHPASTPDGAELDSEKSIFVQSYDANGVSVGDEVVAHNYVQDAQESPQIGMDESGNFVVAWQSLNQDGSTWGVYARQFLANKMPVQTSEFQVNETTDQLQRLVGLGVDAVGNFVIAWESTAQGTDDGISTDIYRREYLPNGTPDGHENLVNTWTGGPQVKPVVARASTGNYGIFWSGQGFNHIDGVHGRLYDINASDDPGTPSRLPIGDQFLVSPTLGFEFSSPALAINSDGTYTLAFETFEEDSSGFGIFKEMFQADGTPVANSRVQVNSVTLDDQSAPAIATDGAGNVLIVWQSKDDATSYGIFGQWYSPDGTTNGDQFQLNSTIAGDQTSPDVAIDEDGNAIVTWQGFDATNGWDVHYVRLEGAGDVTPSSEELANETLAGDQMAPRVAAALPDANASTGQFVITWQGPGVVVEGEASIDAYARRLSSTTTLGSEFIVNFDPESDQVSPEVALDAAGNAVFVWQAEGQQGSGSDVFGRRMSADGTLLGTEDFHVNVTTQKPQRMPSVAMDAAGNFLVSWQTQAQDGYSWGVYGRGYDADGDPVTSEFPINHRVEGPQTVPTVVSNASGQAVVAWLGNSATHEPSIFAHQYTLPATEVGSEILLTNYVGLEDSPPAAAMNAGRESVVAWESYAEDGSGLGIFAQMLDSVGNPIGGRINVNQVTLGNQSSPAVARARSGEFVIAWESEDEDGSGYGVYAQRYSATGVPEGSVFRVNSVTEGDQKKPAVAIGTDGHFIILWQGQSGDGSLDVRGQRYLPDGTTDGAEFVVNEFTGLDQYDPSIAMNAAGQYVVAWVSNHPALEPNTLDTEKSIFLRAFNADGTPVGDQEVLVHRFVKDAQEAPVVGIGPTGQFVVAWQSINQDGNSWGVFARRFEADMTPIDRREFVVNQSRMGPQRYVGLGMADDGRFVITWQSNERAELTDGGSGGGGGGGGGAAPTSQESSWDLFSRQYRFDGAVEGDEQPVATWLQGPQILPVVAQAPNGDFGVFWLGQAPDHVEGVNGRIYQSLNRRPVLDTSLNPSLPTIAEDETNPAGAPVSSLLAGAVTDPDLGAVQGIAVTAASSYWGTWQYSLDGGATWTGMGTPSKYAALLLPDTAFVRFIPNANFNGTVKLYYHAWDQTEGTAGGTLPVTGLTSTSSIGAETESATQIVTPVNDAPVLDNTLEPTLRPTSEDALIPASTRVSDLLAGVTDVDKDALRGIAVTAASNYWGNWQYSLDGGANWSNMNEPTKDAALLLPGWARIRFQPKPDFNGTVGFWYRAWDQTAGTAGGTLSTVSTPPTGSISSAWEKAVLSVLPVNDAPVLDTTFDPVLRSTTQGALIPASTRVGDLLAGVTDVDEGALRGMAVLAASNYWGNWQYSLDAGATWSNMDEPTKEEARLLPASARVRFQPEPDFTGTVKLWFHAWDQTQGVAGGTLSVVNTPSTGSISTAWDSAVLSVLGG